MNIYKLVALFTVSLVAVRVVFLSFSLFLTDRRYRNGME